MSGFHSKDSFNTWYVIPFSNIAYIKFIKLWFQDEISKMRERNVIFAIFNFLFDSYRNLFLKAMKMKNLFDINTEPYIIPEYRNVVFYLRIIG